MLNDRQSLLVSKSLSHIPRGELWLGHRLFQELGWEDDLESRVRLCRDLAMDILFLPVDFPSRRSHLFDYRYFSVDEVSQLVAANCDLMVSVIVDGPFQRLATKVGLQDLMRHWQTMRSGRALPEESAQVSQVISDCLKFRPDALVIADDIAYNLSTYVNPDDLEQSLFVFYRDWVQQAHDHNVLALFHSDGNLTGVVPGLLACGFDGLAGCELECQDILALKRQYGTRLTFLTGIPCDLLNKEPHPSHRKQFTELLTSLASGGRFALGSSCGLSSAQHLSRLRTLYRWADEAWSSGKRSQD